MINRDQIAATRRVIDAARDPGKTATDEDLTEVELIADDLEAAVIAYELWIVNEDDRLERELAAAELEAEVFVS